MASRLSPENRRDRLKRSLPAFALVCLVIFGGGVLILLDSVSPGRIDTQASDRIRALCDDHAPCTVRLGELIEGSWDVFFEFQPTVPQTELRRVTGDDQLHTAHSQRILVLQKDDRVVRRQYAHTGQVGPIAGEVVFVQPHADAHSGWVSFPSNARFTVARCPTREGGSAFGLHGGTYFLLTPANLGTPDNPACPTP